MQTTKYFEHRVCRPLATVTTAVTLLFCAHSAKGTSL